MQPRVRRVPGHPPIQLSPGASRFTLGMRASVWAALLAFVGPLMVNAVHAQSTSNNTAGLSADQLGAIGDHVRKCWPSDPGMLDKQWVLLTVVTDEAGTARKAIVAEEDQPKLGDPRFRAFAERAVRAVLNAQCANLPLPKSLLGRQITLTFRFSPYGQSGASPPGTAGYASAEQPWQTSADQEPVFSAFLRNENVSRVVVECRTPKFDNPEVSLTLVFSDKAKLRPTDDSFLATITIGSASFKIPMSRFGNIYGDMVYRWTSITPNTFNDLAEKISSGTALAVDDGSGASEVFNYTVISAYGVRSVVHRCNPAAVSARKEAQSMTNITALLALENSADRKCRGGSGDQESTWAACDERTEYAERLHVLGMCYGESGQAGYQMRWHRCR